MFSLPRLSLFLTITWSVLFLLHYYVWARLVRDTGLPNPWRLLATLALIVLGCSVPLGMMFLRRGPQGAAFPVQWAVFTWLGMVFLLNVLLALADLGRLLAVTLPHLLTGRPVDPERRRFLAYLVGGLALAGDLGLSAAALAGATAGAVKVKKVRVALRGLPPALEGYRIVQVTDLHVGPTIGRDFVATVVEKVKAVKPDLIAITGDLVDGTVAQLSDQVAPLAGLSAPDGAYFVTGNHEYYTGDVDEWLSWLASIGIRPLRNERVTIRGGFDLAGTDDISARGPGHRQDIPKALSGRKAGRPVVLLAHQPRSFPEAARLGVDLQLAGHTHGGQIYPFKYIVAMVETYVAGLYRRGDSQLYVSCGTGYWGPPMRLGAPAEITEVELVGA